MSNTPLLTAAQPQPHKSNFLVNLLRIKTILLFLCLVALFFAFTPEQAAKGAPFAHYEQLEIAMTSCGMHLIGHDFCEEREPGMFVQTGCLCKNENALATAAHCYITAYPEQVGSFIDMCNKNYDVGLTRSQFDSAVLFYNEKAAETAKQDTDEVESNGRKEKGMTKILDHPLKLNDSLIFTYREMYDMFLGNYNRSIQYGNYMIMFWLVVLGMAAVGNWCKVLVPKLSNQFTGPTSNWIRRKVTLPALFGRYKTNEKPFLRFLDLLVPTRAETLILGTFTAFVAFLSLHHIHYIEGDPFYNKFRALLRYYAIRTGILGIYLFPVSVLFAGRNNILQWVTRWEYATFVTLHRWVSRIMMLLLFIHSNNYALMLKQMKSHKLEELYIFWGIIGTYSGIIIIVQSLLVLRRRWYEAFLIMHIILAGLFMVGAWLHVKELNFLWFAYCSAWLWLLDRVMRIHRLVTFGFPLAEVKLYEDNCLKVSVKKPEGFEAEGGGHCFVHFLHWYCFWQSHPFTYTVVGENIIFYVKVKEGVTQTLGEFLQSHPDQTAHIRVAVEGSYGEATPAAKYNTSVFVAGGNGIPGIFAEAIQAAKSQNYKRKVKLLWVVREYPAVLWFYDELISLKGSPIETEIYVTRPAHRIAPEGERDKSAQLLNTYTHAYYMSTLALSDPVEQLKKDLEHITFKEGRPDIRQIVRSNVKESIGSVAFVTCGHPIMVDDLRHEVVQAIGMDQKRVDFFEQLQVWS